MTPPSERPFRWRHSPDASITVSAAAFARILAENRLVPSKSGGYLWAFVPTEDGYDAYRTVDDWSAVAVTCAATADPAAGADPAVITVPTGKRWLLISAFYTMVTDANVANRYGNFVVTDGTNTVINHQEASAHTAGSTVRKTYNNTAVLDTGGTTRTYNPGLPLEMNAGWTLAITTSSIQATDNGTAIIYCYKEVDA